MNKCIFINAISLTVSGGIMCMLAFMPPEIISKYKPRYFSRYLLCYIIGIHAGIIYRLKN
jgi:hypothetical protein